MSVVSSISQERDLLFDGRDSETKVGFSPLKERKIKMPINETIKGQDVDGQHVHRRSKPVYTKLDFALMFP